MPKPTTKSTHRAREWEDRFLELLRISCNVRLSAQGAGVDHSTVYGRRKKDPEFARLWDMAIEEAIDNLEGIAYDRAVKQSDDLIKFILRGRRAKVYGDRTDVRLAGADGAPFQVHVVQLPAVKEEGE